MNGLEILATIVILDAVIVVGILFEAYIFEKAFKTLQKRVVTRAQKGVAAKVNNLSVFTPSKTCVTLFCS